MPRKNIRTLNFVEWYCTRGGNLVVNVLLGLNAYNINEDKDVPISMDLLFSESREWKGGEGGGNKGSASPPSR